MRRNFFDKRIPTLLGLIVITAGILLTTFLVRSGTLFDIKATAGQEPKNVGITNISDVAFTVSYVTDDSVVGTLSYGTDPGVLDKLILDDRDQLSQSVNRYKVHSITVKDLKPKTTYYFQINSADQTYLDNDSYYNIQTGSTISEMPSDQNPISGKVIGPDGLAPSDGLVFVSISQAQKLSTYLKSDGTYTIPLNTLRNESLNDYLELFENSIINIEVISEDLFSSVSISAKEISPVPLITLSNSYDFSSKSKATSASSKKSQEIRFPTLGPVKRRVGPTPAKQSSIKLTQTSIISPTKVPPVPKSKKSSAIIATINAAFNFADGIISKVMRGGNRSL